MEQDEAVVASPSVAEQLAKRTRCTSVILIVLALDHAVQRKFECWFEDKVMIKC